MYTQKKPHKTTKSETIFQSRTYETKCLQKYHWVRFVLASYCGAWDLTLSVINSKTALGKVFYLCKQLSIRNSFLNRSSWPLHFWNTLNFRLEAGEMAQQLRADCPSRGPGFIPPDPHRDPQPVITAVLGDPRLSSGLQGHQAHTWHTEIYSYA